MKIRTTLGVAGALVAAMAVPGAADAGNGATILRTELSGAQEVPPADTDASGSAMFRVTPGSDSIDFNLRVRNGEDLLGFAGAHIHCAPEGANGPVIAFLAAPVEGGVDKLNVKGSVTDADILSTSCGADVASVVASMEAGDVYVNVHSLTNPAGDVRGQVG